MFVLPYRSGCACPTPARADEITFEWGRDGKLAVFQGQDKLYTTDNIAVALAVFETYLGSTSVSKDALRTMEANFTDMVRRRKDDIDVVGVHDIHAVPAPSATRR